MSPTEFKRTVRAADVVISHAGVGTMLDLFALGVYPVLAVRRAARDEHVDDHQVQIAEMVRRRDLGLAVEGPQLTADVIRLASRRRVVDGLPQTA